MNDSAGPKPPDHVGIRADLAEEKRKAWLERNRTAIDAYNRRIEREGAFSDGLRTF